MVILDLDCIFIIAEMIQLLRDISFCKFDMFIIILCNRIVHKLMHI